MVTPELRNYVQEQIKLGTSSEMIRSALAQSGWQESDINEVLSGASSVSDIRTPAKISPASRALGTSPGFGGVTAGAKDFPAARDSGKISGSQFSAAKENPKMVFQASEAFRSKNEPVFQSKPSSVSSPVVVKTAKSGPAANYRKFILPGGLGLAAIVAIVLAGWLYAQTGGLNSRISSDDAQISSLTQQVGSLTNDKNSLNGQIISLNNAVSELQNELSLLVVAPGVSVAADLPISLKGTLSGGGKKYYAVTSKNGVTSYVKNSDDKNVVSVLKNLIGQEVQIGGTHNAGSNYIMASSVNGQDISVSASQASGGASSTATSTGK